MTDAERWLTSAEEDLAWARQAHASGFHAPACFHSQQAAEKAVKAVHYARGARSILGHSVMSLVSALNPRVEALDRLDEDAARLDLFYIPTRYPNGLAGGTPGTAFKPGQAAEALEAAGRIVDAARAVVEGADRAQES